MGRPVRCEPDKLNPGRLNRWLKWGESAQWATIVSQVQRLPFTWRFRLTRTKHGKNASNERCKHIKANTGHQSDHCRRRFV